MQSDVEHDVERAFECAGFDLACVFEAHNQPCARIAIADGVEHTIGGVLRFVRDIELRGEAAYARSVHLEVNVRRATRVGDGADGGKGVAPSGVDLGAATALEAGIETLLAGGAGVIVDAVRIALPDLYHRPGYE